MELDLLGLGLPPASGGSGGSPAQRPDENTASDEPLRPDAAAEPSALPMRARVRPRPVDMDDDVPAPPASMLKPTSTAAPSPPKVAPTASDLAHAVAMRSAPLQPAGCCRPAASALVGRPPVAAAPTAPDDSTAPMTIIYDGSVRVFHKVAMEQAEKILSVVAKHAQAAGAPPVQRQPDQPRPQQPAPSSATQMMTMLWRLAHLEDNLVPKRTASLARFLDKRKQRVEGAAAAAAATPYPRGLEEEFPAGMDASTTVSARKKPPFGGMEPPLASEDRQKSVTAENHGGEAVNTELKI